MQLGFILVIWFLTSVGSMLLSHLNIYYFKPYVYTPYIKQVLPAHMFHEEEHSSLTCEIPPFKSDTVVKQLIQIRSASVCVTRPDLIPVARKHANYLRLNAQNQKYPGLIAPYFGSFIQIMYLTSRDEIMYNPHVPERDMKQVGTMYCREMSVDGKIREIQGMYQEITVRYWNVDFILNEITFRAVEEKGEHVGETCIVQSLLLDLYAKKKI